MQNSRCVSILDVAVYTSLSVGYFDTYVQESRKINIFCYFLINFILLFHIFYLFLSCVIIYIFKIPESLDFTGKIYKKAFVSVYHILSFARGVKISLWGQNWGKQWGMKTQ